MDLLEERLSLDGSVVIRKAFLSRGAAARASSVDEAAACSRGRNALCGKRLAKDARARRASSPRPARASDRTRSASRSSASRPFGKRRPCSASSTSALANSWLAYSDRRAAAAGARRRTTPGRDRSPRPLGPGARHRFWRLHRRYARHRSTNRGRRRNQRWRRRGLGSAGDARMKRRAGSCRDKNQKDARGDRDSPATPHRGGRERGNDIGRSYRSGEGRARAREQPRADDVRHRRNLPPLLDDGLDLPLYLLLLELHCVTRSLNMRRNADASSLRPLRNRV